MAQSDGTEYSYTSYTSSEECDRESHPPGRHRFERVRRKRSSGRDHAQKGAKPDGRCCKRGEETPCVARMTKGITTSSDVNKKMDSFEHNRNNTHDEKPQRSNARGSGGKRMLAISDIPPDAEKLRKMEQKLHKSGQQSSAITESPEPN